MEKAQLMVDVTQHILQHLEQTKLTVKKQTQTFEHLLMNKIIENYKGLDKERTKNLFDTVFTNKVYNEIDVLFEIYKINEIEFYNKNLKTVDLIFNTLTENRTQIIYLENIAKKINQKNDDFENVFTQPSKNILESEFDEQLSINNMFDNFVRTIIKNPRLSMDEADDFYKLALHYYNLYKNDVLLVIEKFFDYNKKMAITKIEEETDKRKIRNQKTSNIHKLERTITNNSVKVMERLLANIINKHKIIAIKELNVCSSSIVDLIFRLLPLEYQDQKDLLEIIVDTNINERLLKVVQIETKKINDVLNAKNQDLIENELYEEKRYKKIDDYNFDFGLVKQIYKDTLYEIRLAYDISEKDNLSKKLDLIILSENNSIRHIFEKLIRNICQDNNKNLNLIISEMHHISEKSLDVENVSKDTSDKKLVMVKQNKQ